MENRVFLVDDDKFNLIAAGKILEKNNLEVASFESGEAVLEALRKETPDLILLDIQMPGMDGFATLAEIRKIEDEMDLEDIPVIFLTAEENSNLETKGFEMGISDYIRKPFDPAVLMKRVMNVLSRQEMLQRFHAEATRDHLTGLLNKTATNSKLEMLCRRKAGCLMMIDLDSFKLVNDIYGHESGDKILISFSMLLQGFLGEDDVVGRMGGDEFTAFSVSLKTEEEVAEFVKNLNENLVADAKRFFGENMDIPLGTSVGAIWTNGRDDDYYDALRKADKALYQVKNGGKHGYQFYQAAEKEEHDEITLEMLSMIFSERNETASALKLDRASFAGVYRFVMRYIMRYHRNACKILITLTPGVDVSPEEAAGYYEEFGDTVGSVLRRSDLIMQVRSNVYFVILTDIKESAVDQVAGNIVRNWCEKNGNVIEISYEKEFIRAEQIYSGGPNKLWVAVVDDDEMNLKMAKRILNNNDVEVDTMNSGAALLEFLKKSRPDLILLDLNMPEMDGFETLRAIREEETEIADIPVVFLTAEDDTNTEKKALSLGAMDFIRKPFIPEILALRVKQIAELIRLQKRLSEEVMKKTKENEQLFLSVVKSLAGAIDAKDTYTNGHSGRVAQYAMEISRRYGYNEKEQNDIYIMALLHDVGKIGVPDSVINKPGRLTEEEFAQIKKHPVIGSQILKNIEGMPQLSTGARWHHERFGGGGYPDGLVGMEIPEEARIIAVADAYDAMTSKRSYRGIMAQEKVRSEILTGSGTQFDPRFAEIMLKMIDEDPEYAMREE